MNKGMFCNMYLVPYYFFKDEEIIFPKDYQYKFKAFNSGDDILIAYGECLILLQQYEKLFARVLLTYNIPFDNQNYVNDLEALVDILFKLPPLNNKKDLYCLNKKVLKLRHALLHECFIKEHQSIMFHSEEMCKQFNYAYYLIQTLYHSFTVLIKEE